MPMHMKGFDSTEIPHQRQSIIRGIGPLHLGFPEGTHIALLVTKVVHYSVYFT